MNGTKAPIGPKIVRLLVLVAIGIGLAYLMGLLGWPKWIAIVVVLFVLVALSIGWPFYILYKSPSLSLVDRYLQQNTVKPIFGYSYAIAHGTEEDIIRNLDLLIEQFPQPEMQMVYKGNRAFFLKDGEALVAHAETLEPSEHRVYFLALGYIMQYQFEEAAPYEAKLTSPALLHMVRAVRALYEKDRDGYETSKQQIESTLVGLQKYNAYYGLERLELNKP